MVVPELLKKLAYVPDPVRIKIIDPEAIFLTGLLGESGRKLVKGGVEFYFTREIAEKLIKNNVAIEIKIPKINSKTGCKGVDVPKEELLAALEYLSNEQIERLKAIKLI